MTQTPPPESNPDTLTVALLGNPNTGKSTLFTALAGIRQHSGNYPGVTVEKKIGTVESGNVKISLIDLPGTYGLTARSDDEQITLEVLLGCCPGVDEPDVILAVVDASNLERHLYLVSQLRELHRPLVIALNMVDIAAKRSITIDIDQLSSTIGVPVIAVQANRKIGTDQLIQAVVEAAKSGAQPSPSTLAFPPPLEDAVDRLKSTLCEQTGPEGTQDSPLTRARPLLRRMLLNSDLAACAPLSLDQNKVQSALSQLQPDLMPQLESPEILESQIRHDWAESVARTTTTKPDMPHVNSWSERLDRVLTHRLVGTLVFLGLMLVVFQSIYSWASPLMDLIEAGKTAIGDFVTAQVTAGPLQSLIVNGIIEGVGAVVVFVPQIAILFLFIAILEDCGYMARAAFLMDKLMSRMGLSGKSFIPLMSSFACAVPGIMATRVIEDRRDRLATILIAPLMSCSARLPVYVLLIGTFVPEKTILGGWLGIQGVLLFGMHFVGAIVAVPVAWIAKRLLFRGESPSFLLELPTYKVPAPKTVVMKVWDQVYHFLEDAGTIIFATTLVVWGLLYFPHPPRISAKYDSLAKQLEQTIQDPEVREDMLAALEHQKGAEYIEQSFMGRMGKFIEPAVRPLGWDWKIGMASLASFPAREVIVATLGTIYSLGGDTDEESTSLRDRLRREPWAQKYPIPVAASIMVFFALCAQCAATLAVIKRETGQWRWPILTFVYMTGLAYIGAFVTFQVGVMLST